MNQYQAFLYQQLTPSSYDRIEDGQPVVLIPKGPKFISYQEAENYIQSVIDFGVDYTIMTIRTK